MIVLDVLRVTVVGKPYKDALRIDAIERAARAALASAGIEATVTGGQVDGQADA